MQSKYTLSIKSLLDAQESYYFCRTSLSFLILQIFLAYSYYFHFIVLVFWEKSCAWLDTKCLDFFWLLLQLYHLDPFCQVSFIIVKQPLKVFIKVFRQIVRSSCLHFWGKKSFGGSDGLFKIWCRILFHVRNVKKSLSHVVGSV